jgi:hypothetical protein
VDLVHCQQQATEAVAESGGSLQLLSGDLIAATFFDTLAAEVADTLLVGWSRVFIHVLMRYNKNSAYNKPPTVECGNHGTVRCSLCPSLCVLSKSQLLLLLLLLRNLLRRGICDTRAQGSV